MARNARRGKHYQFDLVKLSGSWKGMDQTDHGCEECLRGRDGKTAYGIYVAMNQQIIKARY
ncbi:hypothetical protein HanXRQr2_Chr05g0206451 [Helianthus annuus]|uniref:Uncharacterized protein n=1 Tax=Helianthus annuus TaxID=4232 RepID=A0A9K3NN10_HELAN|nr:hypothetical protein HanXRQr2_Chr05g0206451 [Helianthus annuus]KAJ0576280.1 hypothetical protein HanIR_Chr05g0222561 [Helianthus annuus]KAJ0922080.1 hypothetical protein HanPSC8_Chr05g0199361 [Helianthus annuus]